MQLQKAITQGLASLPKAIITSPKTKRYSDIVLALTLLGLSYPIRKVIEHKIKKEDGGDIYHPRTRIGQNYRPFTMWKYRSMTPDIEAEQNPDKDGLRVTKIGKILRAKALDEIPQLWNVLAGDISMVGPRPLLEEELMRIPQEERDIIMSVPQGIFGPLQNAQIFRPGEISFQSTIDRSVTFAQSEQSIRRGFLYIAGGSFVILRSKEDHKPFSDQERTPKNDNRPQL